MIMLTNNLWGTDSKKRSLYLPKYVKILGVGNYG